MIPTTSNLDKIEQHVKLVMSNELSDKIIYHDIPFMLRVVEAAKVISLEEDLTEREQELLLSAAWLGHLGFADPNLSNEVNNPKDLFNSAMTRSTSMAKTFLESIGEDPDQVAAILQIIEESRPETEAKSNLGRILADAVTSDWGLPKSKRKVKKLYEEFLLVGAVDFGKSTWYDTVLVFLRDHEYYTQYGKRVLDEGKLDLIYRIERDKKNLDKKANTLIKKELSIEDTELKRLKKSLSSVKGRDDRGIQTMFRTTSRNHYTLNQMVDRKANIMITINTILLSLIVSRTIGQIDTFCIHNAPIIVILFFAVLSMAFAILAITPPKTQGTFTEDEIRNKKGNLLYYGNFHNMNFRDFEWGMSEMLNDADYLYSTMIRDLYFLGNTLHIKSKFIRISLGLFVIGLIVATISFFIVASMDDYHFGNATHI